jgi:hypothetical protein
MMWIFLACSSANYAMETAADSTDDMDWEDTAYGELDAAVEDDSEAAIFEEAEWWKLSADVILADDEIDVHLTRELFSAHMDVICEQTLAIESVIPFDSPFGGDERWFSVNLALADVDDCPYTRSETDIQFGVGPLISDLSIATEMVEWNDEADAEVLADIEPLGAYIFDPNQDSVVGYGLSYSMMTETDAERISLRPIYSFAW